MPFIAIMTALGLMIGQIINVLFFQNQPLNSGDILLIAVLLTQIGTYMYGKDRKEKSTM